MDASGDAFGSAGTALYLGYCEDRAGNPGAARAHFAAARSAFAEIDVPGYLVDCVAGLARCALAEGDLAAAGALTGETWAQLRATSGIGVERPLLAYLTCADVFRASGDARAGEAVSAGHRELLARAGRIGDPACRDSFVAAVPEHAELSRRARIASGNDHPPRHTHPR